MRNDQNLFMQRALELAALGGRATLPNPMVGCVIVFEDKIIGEGYHTKFGAPHAEVEAIKSVKDKSLLSKSILYVTLEPCNHFGKTPPCVDLILESKIPHVVVAVSDPFNEVNGKGITRLQEAGVKVEEGLLRKEAIELNKRFFVAHTLKRPYIILKWAETKDGFIARKDGSSKWISSNESRILVHKWRSEEMAIMVGTNTALIDNPELTVRMCEGKNPIRIVLDKDLRLPNNLKLFDKSEPTLVFNSKLAKKENNLEFVKVDISIESILSELYARNIISLFVEGGSHLLNSLIELNLWDEARVFRSELNFSEGLFAPKLKELAFEEQKSDTDLLSIYKNYSNLS